MHSDFFTKSLYKILKLLYMYVYSIFMQFKHKCRGVRRVGGKGGYPPPSHETGKIKMYTGKNRGKEEKKDKTRKK